MPSTGFSNGTMCADNVCFNGTRTPQMTTSGEVIVGTGAGTSPAIKQLSVDFDFSAATAVRIKDGAHIFYVSSNGNDTYDGLTIQRSFLTFGAALTAAAAAIPSAVNRFSIVCLDNGIFTENITCVQYVDIYAPNTTLVGTITCADDSEVKFMTQGVASGTIGVLKAAGAGTSRVDIDIQACAGTGIGFLCTSGILMCKWKTLTVTNGFGIGDLTSALGHMHISGGDIYITGTGIGIARANLGTTVGAVDHILNQGAGTGTAIAVFNGTVDINVNNINATAAYNVNGATSVMRLFVNEVSGTRTAAAGGIAKIWVPPTAMTNGQLVIGSTGVDPVVGSLASADASVTITPGAGTIDLSAASAITVAEQVFTGDGTYTPTVGMRYCIIEVLGGGGGGGGSAGGALGSAAGGGGGGGYARGIFDAATIGASQVVTVGAAGAAGASGNNAGGTGGTTSVGALISATGGVGGSGGPNGQGYYSAGGAGGAGASGSFQTTGAPGSGGFQLNITGVFSFGVGGQGGSSFFGGGARTASSTAAGTAATSYGGGGGGGSVAFAGASVAGGAGVGGIVIVTEYI